MRIVADTNTVLSGLLWKGPPRQIIDRARVGVITLHTSLLLLAELAEVIGRDKFTRRIRNAELSAGGLAADDQRLAILADPQPLAEPISRDPEDDHGIACALAAAATLIVSGDDDLLSLGSFREIRILTAREALEIIASGTR